MIATVTHLPHLQKKALPKSLVPFFYRWEQGGRGVPWYAHICRCMSAACLKCVCVCIKVVVAFRGTHAPVNTCPQCIFSSHTHVHSFTAVCSKVAVAFHSAPCTQTCWDIPKRSRCCWRSAGQISHSDWSHVTFSVNIQHTPLVVQLYAVSFSALVLIYIHKSKTPRHLVRKGHACVTNMLQGRTCPTSRCPARQTRVQTPSFGTTPKRKTCIATPLSKHSQLDFPTFVLKDLLSSHANRCAVCCA